MLYLITSQPGDDMGNVVSWRDIKKPESVSQENFRVEIKSENFRVQTSKCTKPDQRTAGNSMGSFKKMNEKTDSSTVPRREF